MRNRITLFFIFMVMFSGVYQLGAISEVREDDAKAFMEEFEDLVQDIDAIGIFTHNTSISLPMFLPGIGMVWGMFSAWSTGFAFASIVTLTPEMAKIPPLVILYASPFGLMELAAYSLATSRSYILIRLILKKTNPITVLKPTLIEVGILIGLLLAGGYLEFYMIQLTQNGDLQIPGI